jgi:hypothetical protein
MKHFPNFRDLERVHGITWHDLVELEPDLAELLRSAHCVGSLCHRWSDVEAAFTAVRNSLSKLVGFAGRHHRHPLLGSPAAYEVAYWKLYDAAAALVLAAEKGGEERRVGTVHGAAEEDITARLGTRWPRDVPLPPERSSTSDTNERAVA